MLVLKILIPKPILVAFAIVKLVSLCTEITRERRPHLNKLDVQ